MTQRDIFCFFWSWVEFSVSNVMIEGIKAVLVFLYEKISQAQKAQIAKKSRLSLKRLLYTQKAKIAKKSGLSIKRLLYAQKAKIAKKKRTFTKMFNICTKAIKSTNSKQDFLDALHIKDAVLFVIFLTLNESKFH